MHADLVEYERYESKVPLASGAMREVRLRNVHLVKPACDSVFAILLGLLGLFRFSVTAYCLPLLFGDRNAAGRPEMGRKQASVWVSGWL